MRLYLIYASGIGLQMRLQSGFKNKHSIEKTYLKFN